MPRPAISELMKISIVEKYAYNGFQDSNENVHQDLQALFGENTPGQRMVQEELKDHRRRLTILREEPEIKPMSGQWPKSRQEIGYLVKVDRLAQGEMRWTADRMEVALELQDVLEPEIDQGLSGNWKLDHSTVDPNTGHVVTRIGRSATLVIIEEAGDRRTVGRHEEIEPDYSDIYSNILYKDTIALSDLSDLNWGDDKWHRFQVRSRYPLLNCKIHGFSGISDSHILERFKEAHEAMGQLHHAEWDHDRTYYDEGNPFFPDDDFDQIQEREFHDLENIARVHQAAVLKTEPLYREIQSCLPVSEDQIGRASSYPAGAKYTLLLRDLLQHYIEETIGNFEAVTLDQFRSWSDRARYPIKPRD